jgi:signal transduction histidine kinase
VKLTASGEGDSILLKVQNWGLPIPPDSLATIFDPLVRVPSPESRQQRRRGSLGLGLYIAREIVSAHSGTIDVRSSENEGTVFTIRLPRRQT